MSGSAYPERGRARRILLASMLLAVPSACARPPAVPATPPAELVGPLQLLSHNHAPLELLVFERPRNRAFVSQLIAAVDAINFERSLDTPPIEVTVLHWKRDYGTPAEAPAQVTPVRRLAVDARYDVWLQDFAEFAVSREGDAARLVLVGPRRIGSLEHFTPRLAERWGARWVPLPGRRGGANGAGNVEVLPDDLLLLGSTAGPELVEFLFERGYRERHAIVDTSWLAIGHVDEVVSHVVTGPGPCGFALVRASPALGLALARADEQPPEWLRWRVGTAEAPTRYGRVQEALEARIQATVAGVQAASAALRPACEPAPVVELPVLFECKGGAEAPRGCWGTLPNPVNMTVLDRHVLVPDPRYGPFQGPIVEALRASGQVPYLLDAAFYHRQLGGIHCATNVRRDPRRLVAPPPVEAVGAPAVR